jgi:N-acetylneuraminic acid mutarotase
MAPYKWTQVNAAAPFAPRDGAGALVFADKIWLLGGWNPGDKTYFPRICNNEVWSSPDGADWKLVKDNTFADGYDPAGDWEGRHTAGYAVYQDRMWIVGGDGNQGHYQSDVWSSADGVHWDCVNSAVPWGPRLLHYTFVFKDKIWILGGQTLPQFAPAAERFYDDVWHSKDGIEWQQLELDAPRWTPRGMIGGSAVFDNRVWILGGGTYETPTRPDRSYYNDIWSSADGVHWQCHLEAAPWPGRDYHEVAVFDDKLWVLEGYDGTGNRNDVWYSPDGEIWHELPDTPWAPRHAASVCVHRDALWVIAGNNMASDVWKLERAD